MNCGACRIMLICAAASSPLNSLKTYRSLHGAHSSCMTFRATMSAGNTRIAPVHSFWWQCTGVWRSLSTTALTDAKSLSKIQPSASTCRRWYGRFSTNLIRIRPFSSFAPIHTTLPTTSATTIFLYGGPDRNLAADLLLPRRAAEILVHDPKLTSGLPVHQQTPQLDEIGCKAFSSGLWLNEIPSRAPYPRNAVTHSAKTSSLRMRS